MKANIPWARIGAEGTVIVVSILLAFAIDASWDARKARADERELLVAVQAELELAAQTLQDGLDFRRAVLDSAQLALAFARGESRVRPSAEFTAQMLVANTSTHLETGTLDGALASGGLAVVRDGGIRTALAAWPRAFREFAEEEENVWDLLSTSRSDVTSTLDLSGAFMPDGVSDGDVDSFLATLGGRNFFALRAFYEETAVRDGEELLSRLEDIISLLRSTSSDSPSAIESSR